MHRVHGTVTYKVSAETEQGSAAPLSFHSHPMLPADGIGTAPTPFQAVQVAAWRALNPMRMPTPGSEMVGEVLSSLSPAILRSYEKAILRALGTRSVCGHLHHLLKLRDDGSDHVERELAGVRQAPQAEAGSVSSDLDDHNFQRLGSRRVPCEEAALPEFRFPETVTAEVKAVCHPIILPNAPLDLIGEDRRAAGSTRLLLAVASEELLGAFSRKNSSLDLRADQVAEA